MNKIIPTIADMPQEDRDIVDYYLTDLVQVTRELFDENLRHVSNTELRKALITLMEHGFFKIVEDGDYVKWLLYQPSSDKWIMLPTSRACAERRLE